MISSKQEHIGKAFQASSTYKLICKLTEGYIDVQINTEGHIDMRST